MLNSLLASLFLSTCILFGFTGKRQNEGPWTAPPEADKLVNPFSQDAGAVAEGKKIYMQVCAACHGNKGNGDGPGGMGLQPPPGVLSGKKSQGQSDGALFWKISNGRPPMAAYKDTYTEKQRWQLVSFIRTLSKTAKKK